MKTLAKRSELSQEEWLDLRRTGIGGSDAGAILGLSKYNTPLGVWSEKTGLADTELDNEQILWGTALEPVIKQMLPKIIMRNEEIFTIVADYPAIVCHDDYPWMQGNLDGLVIFPESKEAILEVKVTNLRMAEQWKDDNMPDSAYCQVQHYMAITGHERAVVAPYIGNTLPYKYVPRNDEFIEKVLIPREQLFWERNVMKRQPPLAESDIDIGLLAAMFPEATEQGSLIVLDDSFVEDRKQYHELKASSEKLKGMMIEIQARVMQAMGENKYAMIGDKKVTWSRYDRSYLDQERLKKEHPEIVEEYRKSSRVSRLTL